MFVLAQHDARQAWHRRPRHLQLLGTDFQAREVPQRRRGDLQVRVVGQQRLAARRAAAREHPVVGAYALDARRRRRGQQAIDHRRRCRHRRAERAAEPEPAIKSGVVGRRERLVARIWRQQLVDARHRQGQRQPRAQQLGAPVAAQVPGHHHGPGQAVDRRPVLDGQAHQQHLGRSRCHVLALPGVDARAIGQQHAARLAGQTLPLGLGGAAHAERAQKTVAVERSGTEGLGQAAAADAAVRLELPEPVLRMRETEPVGHVLDRRAADRRYAVRVALDAHRARQPCRAQLTRLHGCGAPEVQGQHGGEQQQQDEHAGEQLRRQPPEAAKPAHRAAAPRALSGPGSRPCRVPRRRDAAARTPW